MLPVRSSMATIIVVTALPVWLQIMRRFFENRSAMAPPNGEIMAMGAANATIISDRENGESSVRRKINQPRVTICMFMAV